jgi:hypothetical protein
LRLSANVQGPASPAIEANPAGHRLSIRNRRDVAIKPIDPTRLLEEDNDIVVVAAKEVSGLDLAII